MKRDPLARWAETAAEKIGGQAKLARLLSEYLGRPVDRSIVNKIIGGDRKIKANEMLAIEQVTGIPAPSVNLPAQVPLIDYVSAGRLAEPRSQIPVENVQLLAFADLGKGEFFALRVDGTSMDRVSPEGSIIIVDRADRSLISGKCYVFAFRGETTYKRWQKGDPPYLAPYSTDPSHSPIFVKQKKDLEVIGRVRRTLLDL